MQESEQIVYFVEAEEGWYYGISSRRPIPSPEWEGIYGLLRALRPYKTTLEGSFVGAQPTMESPWSTGAKEILATMGLNIRRIERFRKYDPVRGYDPLLEARYEGLSAALFTTVVPPAPTLEPVADLFAYNKVAHLALSSEELALLQAHASALGRNLSAAEVFGWAQIHSEHCRHKTFGARFVLNGIAASKSPFDWIKATTAAHPNRVVSAYKDNVAFLEGPRLEAFAPEAGDRPSFFKSWRYSSVLSLKAETHNFPTTVEPFYGAGTGTGGEIRDRMAGGQGSLPLAGTAVYMTPYARIGQLKPWEQRIAPRPWCYQRPDQLLIKASNGASDYANKFGQPLVCGSLLTFEHKEPKGTVFSYDKVLMLAGGVGVAQAAHAQKKPLGAGDLLILLGGDNYRIGLGGGAVSSVATGDYAKGVEQQAIQRANPEMQKRVFDCLRALIESGHNPIRSIHDHGAGGHLNCFAELLEGLGGDIYLDALPVGDASLSYRELLCNESQERMGLVIAATDLPQVQAIAEREHCPLYVVGQVTNKKRIRCIDRKHQKKAVDMPTEQLIGSLPQRSIEATPHQVLNPSPLALSTKKVYEYTADVLSLEGVASKDWLTNKVDRCVGGRVAMQPCCGPLQLPLNNLGVVKLDFGGQKGLATALGHAPGAALLSAAAGSRLAMAEALTNLLWAPLSYGLAGVSLSANWMWPQGKGESARLYEAVEALSRYAVALGVNIPTGKDSLSMQQRYPSGEEVPAPGTLVLSAVAEVQDVRKLVSPVLQKGLPTELWYVPLGMNYHLGGSALAQTLSQIGDLPPEPLAAAAFARAFAALQGLVQEGQLLAGHDIGSGGLLTSLLELCFAMPDTGLVLDLSEIEAPSLVHILFSESPGVLLQVAATKTCYHALRAAQLRCIRLGAVAEEPQLRIHYRAQQLTFDVNHYRKCWFARSAALDAWQRPAKWANQRKKQLEKQPLQYSFPKHFTGRWPRRPAPQKQAAILREKGSNSDKEVAYALHKAGFKVKDLHTSDLNTGRSTLQEVDFLVFVGGFSHADVLGAARGWAATFQHNAVPQQALQDFYARADVLSLGICNGCQLMGELCLLGGKPSAHPRLEPNFSGHFECAFVLLEIMKSPSLLFGSLAGLRLGAWAAHREGRFVIPRPSSYPLVARYAYNNYPGNPNGSDLSAACLCSADGRHNAIMPHIERALQPCNWPYYPSEHKHELVSPWILPFVSARDWLLKH